MTRTVGPREGKAHAMVSIQSTKSDPADDAARPPPQHTCPLCGGSGTVDRDESPYRGGRGRAERPAPLPPPTPAPSRGTPVLMLTGISGLDRVSAAYARLRLAAAAHGAIIALHLVFAIGVAAFVLGMAFLAGCGASAVRVNAEAADTLGRALDVAGDEVVTHRNADVLAAAHTGSTPAEATAAIEDAAAHWAPAVAAEETAAAAQRAYADAVVELAAERTTEAHVLGLLVALARTYQSLAAALEPVGVHVPALPAWAAHALDAGGSP